ncbi:winged helix-turn-helix domain-containing protein [Candidatus Viadribacter manganicus]|uniref:OmpR/PhoB-type domain-containing protein n=1 Tax=Candidatus Viadribacter manganicus TaxID=1759059 RepID=A0A1B1AH46_9PROT|nr:winged helix-turn-helix domain-containing protein [Candidatus Viadribacter manganicus]ANP45884.1 hypothetical protein ATE48_08095 [Candidatus Viadribacter manganicus]
MAKVSPSALPAGPFSIDLDRMRVTRGNATIALSGQPLQILVALVKAGGRVVTREELMLLLWPEASRIDTGRRLNTAVRALREALGDGADTPVFVETVRGRGYRWIDNNAPLKVRTWPAARPFAAAVLAMAASVLIGSTQFAATPASAVDRERLVDIAALANDQPDVAIVALDRLLQANPSYEAAQVLRAELALKAWRDQPSQARLQAARAAVRDAHSAFRQNAELAVIEAELAWAGGWDWRGAERMYRRALAASPSHVGARAGLSWLLLNAGREEEAFAEIVPLLTRAELEPSQRAQLGWFLLRLQRNDLAARMCAGDSRHLNMLSCRHTAMARLGDEEGARAAAAVLMQQLDASPRDLAAVRTAEARIGYSRFLVWCTEHFPVDDTQHFQRAQIAAAAGRLDEAMAQLDSAFAARDPALVKLRTTYEFAMLRHLPRFARMLHEIGPA